MRVTPSLHAVFLAPFSVRQQDEIVGAIRPRLRSSEKVPLRLKDHVLVILKVGNLSPAELAARLVEVELPAKWHLWVQVRRHNDTARLGKRNQTPIEEVIDVR